MLNSIEDARAHLPPEEIDTLVYHNYCSDGLISAWAGVLTHNNLNLIPASYTIDFNKYDFSKSKNILILDFSFTAAELDSLVKAGKKVLVLDHHKTAEENLSDYPYAYIDKNRAGAGLAWAYFYPNTPNPWPVAAAQDRDLWRFEYEDTKPYSEVLYEKLKDVGMNGPFMFSKLPDLFSAIVTEEMIKRGNELLVKKQESIDKACTFAKLKTYKHGDCTHTAAFLFLSDSELRSEIGAQLCKMKAVDFTFMYWRAKEPGKYGFSLRSIGEFDTTGIAKALSSDGKGGGHRNASGGGVNYDPETVFNDLIPQNTLFTAYRSQGESAGPSSAPSKKRSFDQV